MRHIGKDQRGAVSIIVVMVFMTVATLVTLGFSNIVRREQRQSLDRQLSGQAKLAAEAAVNDVIARIRANPALLPTLLQDTCEPESQTFTDGDEMTTCVLVDDAPGPIQFDEVTTGDSKVLWLEPGTVELDRLVITWQKTATSPSDCLTTAYSVLPNNLTANQINMLRFDLHAAGPDNAPFNRQSLRNNHFSGVLYPRSGGTAESLFTGSVTGQPIIFGTCGVPVPAGVTDPYRAHAVIQIPAGLQNNRFMLRIRGIYGGSKVKVVGLDASDKVVPFKGPQIVIEASARVQDVVQRIQVRIPANDPPRDYIPDSALQVGNNGVCKMLTTEPAGTSLGGC